MRRLLLTAMALAIAATASAQVTRLKPDTQGAFVHTNPGALHILAGWRVDTDPLGRYDESRPHCILVEQDGEYVMNASVQWSLQNSDPQSGSRGITISRQQGNSTPEALESAVVVPVQDFVTVHDVSAQATLQAGDCVFVAVKQTSGDNVFALGTVFWLAPVVERRRTLFDWFQTRRR